MAETYVLGDILEDVLFYRQEVALSSYLFKQFKPCFRAYRAYLFSCITALDSFLNYKAWFYSNDPLISSSLSSRNKKLLEKKTLSLNNKLRTWIPILTNRKTIDENSESWKKYNEIRIARNNYIHVNEPDYMFALRDVAIVLNYCHFGIGQLFLDIYSILQSNPIPEILKIKYAPKATFLPK